MNNYFSGVNPYNSNSVPGNSQSAATFSDLVQRIVQSNSGKQRALKPAKGPQIEGRLWEDCRNIAEEALSNKNYSRAEAMLLKAVSKAEDLPLRDWRRVYGLESLLSLYYSQERYDEAEVFIDRYSSHVQAVYGIDHVKTGDAFNFVASIYFSLGKLDDAAENALKALSVYKHGEHPDPVKLGMVLYNLGVICQQLGDFANSDTYYKQAYGLRVEMFGEDHTETQKIAHSYHEMLEDKASHEAARKIINRLMD